MHNLSATNGCRDELRNTAKKLVAIFYIREL